MFCCYLSHVAQLFLPVEFQTEPYQQQSGCLTLGLLQVKAHYKDRPAVINRGQSQEDTLWISKYSFTNAGYLQTLNSTKTAPVKRQKVLLLWPNSLSWYFSLPRLSA